MIHVISLVHCTLGHLNLLVKYRQYLIDGFTQVFHYSPFVSWYPVLSYSLDGSYRVTLVI